MLSFNSAYTAQASSNNIQVNWLLELSYDDTTPGTFYLSDNDLTITNRYHGLVEDWGDISETIDLATSQNTVGDITISVVNKWANNSGLLSAELYGGSKKFFNQDVTIKSHIPGCTLAQCPTIFVGRLVDFTHNQQVVKLIIERRSPWDRVKFPSDYTSDTKFSEPHAVGNFAGSNGGTLNPLKSLRPAPAVRTDSNTIFCAEGDIGSGENGNYYHYERATDEFIQLDSASLPISGDYSRLAIDLARDEKFRPIAASADNDFTNPLNAVDGSGGTYASQIFDVSDTFGGGGGTATESKYLDFDFPAPDHTYTALQIYYSYNVTIDAIVGVGAELKIEDNTLGTLRTVASITTETTSTSTNTINIFADYDGTLPTSLQLKATASVSTPDAESVQIQGWVRIYDVYVILSTEVDFTDPQNGLTQANNIDMFYSDNTGLDMSFTDFSGDFYDVWPHNIYLTWLETFLGWSASEADAIEVNNTPWSESSIDTDRDWDCRWWTLEQMPLVDALKQLQFEGALIWIFENTGIEGRFIYVKSSYSSADFEIDYKDIDNLQVGTTPFSEIVTSRKFNYQRHPADESRYILSENASNANRSSYNLETEENVIEQNLDFLTNEQDVTDLLAYYDNIVGEPKIIVTCDLLKPTDRAMQVGDVVTFANMEYQPYGKDWTTPIYFMCVNTIQNPNKFTATFREVG